jgi:endoglucanase
VDMLQVRQGKIVDTQDHPLQLRGTCIGGWLNMENFINGYPGAEHTLRATMSEVLGASKAQFFFDRLLDYFVTEADIAFIKKCGANVVRLPLNYRHFEADSRPFEYLESGFERLNRVLNWCAKHQIYAILDLHAVQGWQSTDWHCDNANRLTLFWEQPHFQERFVRLWEEFARRYAGNSTVAGYNVMNEPLCNARRGRFHDWDTLNGIYRRVVSTIRAIDPRHIIFLEGDSFSTYFSGLDAPFADNLVYSSHNYTGSGFGPGVYPGEFWGEYWDKTKQTEKFLAHEGTQFTQKHNVPLWVGEFGSVYTNPSEESHRLHALDDQLAIFEQYDAHWTTWTYKDVGVMSWVTLDPASDYLQLVAPVQRMKDELHADFWMGWLPATSVSEATGKLARAIEQTIGDPEILPWVNERYLAQAALDNYAGGLLQPYYARCFKGLSESELDRILQAFAFENCRPRENLINLIKVHTKVV